MQHFKTFALILLFFSALQRPALAQFYDITRAIIDHAASRSTPPASEPRRQRPRVYRANRESSDTTKTPTTAGTDAKSLRRFDGTWLATRSKTGMEGERVMQMFTMIIKNGKATKTLDTTNISSVEKPFHESTYELHRKWTYDAEEMGGEGASLTIQWRAGQLADWAPKTVPTALVDSFGSPGAETSVYTLKGDDLTRINDPAGVTYHRAK